MSTKFTFRRIPDGVTIRNVRDDIAIRVDTAKLSQTIISETISTTLIKRHETHLEMEESTHKQLESVVYEWSQKPLIEVIG